MDFASNLLTLVVIIAFTIYMTLVLSKNSASKTEGDIEKYSTAPKKTQNPGLMKSDFVLYNIKEGLILLDVNKKILNINKPAVKLLQGSDKFDYKDKNIIFLSRNHEILQLVDEAYTNGNVAKTVQIGSSYVKLYLNPIHEDTRLIGIMCLLIDDTLSFNQELTKRRFTANISHELKTPLTAIKGYADILCSMDVSLKESKQFAAKIKKSADQMTILINNIIKLSSLDENATGFAKTILDLSSIVRNCVSNQVPNAEFKKVSLDLDVDDEIVFFANEELVSEMISNLISNAIRYNYEKGKVKVVLSKLDNTSVLSISDTGQGIPEKYLNRIFDRFFVVDKSRSKQSGGSGIGLCIVKHIAQIYNIEIKVTSVEGKGSVFTLIFPKVDTKDYNSQYD